MEREMVLKLSLAKLTKKSKPNNIYFNILQKNQKERKTTFIEFKKQGVQICCTSRDIGHPVQEDIGTSPRCPCSTKALYIIPSFS